MSIVMLNATTALAVTRTSIASGPWSTVGTWTPSGVPAAGDDAIIAAGHTITMTAVNTVWRR